MESYSEEHVTKLLQARSHINDQSMKFVSPMSLKCAIELSIPDIIHKYGQPMPLSQLIASLPIHPSKSSFIYHLMRILAHFGFFSQHNVIEHDKQEVRYALTDPCKLLLKDHPLSMKTLYQLAVDTSLIKSWCQLSTWLTNEDLTPFLTENGMSFWDYMECEPKFNQLFNDAMKCGTQFDSSVIVTEKFMEILRGLESLVDVGGGTGTMAKVISKSFPKLKYIVFDLPRVVGNLQGTENISYVEGDMFKAFPSADSIMLKSVLHNWNDEECIKILNKCKEAIPSHGKVILIDIVMESKTEDEKLIEQQFWFDIHMTVVCGGKERNEKELANLIFSAGFKNYKITPIPGVLSIIEVYP